MKVTFELPEADLKSIIRTSLVDFDNEKNKNGSIVLYTINQVAKKLGKAHPTIKKMIERGVLKATKDNLITEAAINEYLQTS